MYERVTDDEIRNSELGKLFSTAGNTGYSFEFTLSSSCGRHEIEARRHIADMAPIFDGQAVIGRWDRIDHAYETIRALCRSFQCGSFKVKV